MTMTPIFGISSLLDSITMESLAVWLARATVIAAIACAFLALARRVRPATRCVVAVASVCAIVMLPVASAILPALSVPVLPAERAEVPEPVRAPSVPFAIDTPPTASAEGAPAPAVVPAASVIPAPAKPIVPTPPARKSFMTSIARAVSTVAMDAARSIGWGGFVLLTWASVSACLLSWIGIGAIGARRLARRSAPVTDEYLRVEYERACRVLGIRRQVDIGITGDITVPIVVGALHPRVVLPLAAAAWSRERLATVLLHELAHVRRRDGLWMMIVRTARALVWFHPLMWVLASHARRDAERACDELVLASGVRGSDYAEHLIAIARSAMARDPYAGTALALATRSSLETRVVAILSTRLPRGSMTRRAAVCAIATSLVLFMTIAATRPTQVESAAPVLTAASVDLVEIAPTPMNIEPKCREAVMEEVQVAAAAALAPDADPFIYVPDAVEPVITVKPVIAVKPVINVKPIMLDKIALKAARKAAKAQSDYYMTGNKDGNRSGHEWYERASELYNSKRYARAGEAYENAAREGYRPDVAFYNAGCSYALADQSGRAIDMLREAFEEGFDDPQKYAEDSDLNSLRGDPRFKDLINDLMESGTAQSQHREAAREYERMANRKNVEEGEWNSIGIELLRSGDYETAAQAFDREFQLSKDEDALYNKACARSLAGKTDDALKLLEQAITTGSVNADHMKRDPDLVALHGDKKFKELYVLADDLTLQGGDWWNSATNWIGKDDGNKHWKRSIGHYEDVAQEHPKIGRAWFNLGFAQLAGDDAKNSVGSFQKALDLGYKTPTTMYNLGCANSEAGNVDAAISWLEKAEGAGFEIWNYARHDDDLDPIRDDPRFRKMAKRWREIERAKRDHDWDDEHEDDDDKDT